MPLNKKPVNGMKDILPDEMAIRAYVSGVIRETYSQFGFAPIETPCVEHIGNLSSKQGGENEKLIFKILKRGEKLDLEHAEAENDLVDGGLRYDLTVPLVRFFANHENELPVPFKALQMGNVWRADRPQRGRYRQFMQCDIDILGEASELAEIELILATATTLGRIGFKNFQIRISDRRVLKAMAEYSGFAEEAYDSIFIILDKMDKIGTSGVAKELLAGGFPPDSVSRYMGLFEELKAAADGLAFLMKKLEGIIAPEAGQNLTDIITAVQGTAAAEFAIVFDPTLVRGMSYYTGSIFEVSIPEFGGSCGGGGRYDKLVGQFSGKEVPACGFSIGFERIILLLKESGFKLPAPPVKKAYLLEKGLASDEICRIIKQAQEERQNGCQVSIVRMNKNKKFQKEQLSKEGYQEFVEFFI